MPKKVDIEIGTSVVSVRSDGEQLELKCFGTSDTEQTYSIAEFETLLLSLRAVCDDAEDQKYERLADERASRTEVMKPAEPTNVGRLASSLRSISHAQVQGQSITQEVPLIRVLKVGFGAYDMYYRCESLKDPGPHYVERIECVFSPDIDIEVETTEDVTYFYMNRRKES